MRCNRNSSGTARASRSGFTLAEVLAALAFMAIVIPVAVQGIQVAGRAGQVALRKADAVRIAERVLSELEVTGMLDGGSQSGVIEEGAREFSWNVRSQPWIDGSLDEVRVNVAFEVQGQTFEVWLTTLVDPNAETVTAAETTASETEQ